MFFRLIECYFPMIPQNSLGQADLDSLRRAIAELTSSISGIDANSRAALDSAKTAEALARANANGIASNAASIVAIETTISVWSSSVASNFQRLDNLEASIGSFSIPVPASGVDIEITHGLQNQIDALKVRADTALQTARNAEALAKEKVDLTRIKTRLNQQEKTYRQP